MANAFDAFNQGFNTAGNVMDTFAQQRAGNALAGGDYTGAANELYKSGQLDAGSQVQNMGQAQHKQELADKLAFMDKAAASLSQIPDDPAHAKRNAAFEALVPTFQAMGYTPDAINSMRNADKSDQSLAVFRQAVAKQYQAVKGEDGSLGAFDPTTGTYKQIMPGSPKPEWKEIKDANGNTIGYVDVNDPANMTGAAPAAGGTPSQQAAGAAAAPSAAPTTYTPQDRAALAKMIASEAGGEGPQGMLAAGYTALNRLKAGKFGSSISDVVNAPGQYEGMTSGRQIGPQEMAAAQAVADQILSGQAQDPTNGATNFYNPALQAKLKRPTPAFAQGQGQRIGNHVFFGGGAQVAQAGSPTLQGGQGADVAAPAMPQFKGRAVIFGTPGKADQGGLTDDARDMNAMRFVMTGQLPQEWGKFGTADKQKIMNRAAEFAKQYNIKPEDWVTGMAQFKVTQGSLQQTSKTLAVLQPSEQAVNSNLQLALSLAPKGGGGTNIPVFNRWLQAGRKATGDADVTRFQQALQTVAVEYGKVMSTTSGGGNQALSDDARRDAYNRLNSAQTVDQLRGRLEIIQREMENKVNAFRDEQAALTSQLRNGLIPGATPGASPSPGSPGPTPLPSPPGQPRIRRYNPATGRLE